MQPRLIHFLLVEDDDDHADLVLQTLKRNQVQNTIDRVGDGLEALAYLRREGRFAGSKRPDVILLDLNLPKLDGHEVLARIKEDPDVGAIPVVILTTSATETDRIRAYKYRANSYVVKPVDFEQFTKMIIELNLYWGVLNWPPA